MENLTGVDTASKERKLSSNDELMHCMTEIHAMNPIFKGVCFLHQLYAFSDANKTTLDKVLEKHKESGEVRIFQTQFGLALMKNSDYCEELRCALRKEGRGKVYQSAISKFSALMNNFNKISVTKSEMVDVHGFSEEELQELQSSLFLLNRRDVEVTGLYWLYWPHFSRLLTDLSAIRTKMVAAIKRSRFKEMSASALQAVVVPATRPHAKAKLILESAARRKKCIREDDVEQEQDPPLGKKGGASLAAASAGVARYYQLDLVGSGMAREVKTHSGGSIFRLGK